MRTSCHIPSFTFTSPVRWVESEVILVLFLSWAKTLPHIHEEIKYLSVSKIVSCKLHG